VLYLYKLLLFSYQQNVSLKLTHKHVTKEIQLNENVSRKVFKHSLYQRNSLKTHFYESKFNNNRKAYRKHLRFKMTKILMEINISTTHALGGHQWCSFFLLVLLQ